MGRFKARLAKEPFDREMHEHLAKAERALAQAEAICVDAVRSLRGPSSKYGGQFASRAQVNLRGIRAAKQMVGRIGLSVPNRDFSDTDMLSEDELSKRARVERELKAETQRAALQEQIAATGDEG